MLQGGSVGLTVGWVAISLSQKKKQNIECDAIWKKKNVTVSSQKMFIFFTLSSVKHYLTKKISSTNHQNFVRGKIDPISNFFWKKEKRWDQTFFFLDFTHPLYW